MLLCYGVWFQLFIGTTVHYKLPEHESSNLRGDKCKNGQSYCEYINDCLPPNVVCEKCNLNEIECEWVNNSTSCVPPKRFNRRGSKWQWCGDGRCVRVGTPCGTNPCKQNEFMCGGECKSQEYQDQFRTCQKECVKRNERCFRVQVLSPVGTREVTVVPATINQTKPNQTAMNWQPLSGSLGWWVAVVIIAILLICGVYYLYKKCTDSAGEMDRDMSPSDTLDTSMNDVHSSTITVPSTATECTTQRNSPTNSTPSTPRALKSTDPTDPRNALAPSHCSTQPRTTKSTAVKRNITERSDPRNASPKLTPSDCSTTPRITKSTAVKQKISERSDPRNASPKLTPSDCSTTPRITKSTAVKQNVTGSTSTVSFSGRGFDMIRAVAPSRDANHNEVNLVPSASMIRNSQHSAVPSYPKVAVPNPYSSYLDITLRVPTSAFVSQPGVNVHGVIPSVIDYGTSAWGSSANGSPILRPTFHQHMMQHTLSPLIHQGSSYQSNPNCGSQFEAHSCGAPPNTPAWVPTGNQASLDLLYEVELEKNMEQLTVSIANNDLLGTSPASASSRSVTPNSVNSPSSLVRSITPKRLVPQFTVPPQSPAIPYWSLS